MRRAFATRAKRDHDGSSVILQRHSAAVRRSAQSHALDASDFSAVPVSVRERGGPMGDLEREPVARRGGTVPYREATEFTECIRIMGEANREYCRETVLGEKKKGCDAGLHNPLADFSTFQSPGGSGWWGAKFGCYRNGCSRSHRGWDIHAQVGTSVVAAETGNTTHHQNPGGWGDYIRLTSGADATRVYLYAHLSARQPAGRYCAGATIGQSGTSGNASATRPHLHFEVHVNGVAVDPGGSFTEPAQVIEATGSSAVGINKALPEPCSPCGM